MKYTDELNGAWEMRGVIGSRIEIDGKNIVILWRNAPVLDTTFKVKESDGAIELILKKDGMRYAGTYSDYATVKSITLRDGKLEFVEHFPITGDSKTVMEKTSNSRYGNYEIVDGILDELQGVWKSADGFVEIKIEGDRMTFDGVDTRIHVLRSLYESAPKGQYLIADRDPSVYGWGGFDR